jgi:hypothetical protein
VIAAAVVASLVVDPGVALAATTCRTSNGHTLCVTAPNTAFSGPTPMIVKNTANSGTVIATWIPTGRPGIHLIQKKLPSAATNDYSFVWPTQKSLDASGTLLV